MNKGGGGGQVRVLELTSGTFFFSFMRKVSSTFLIKVNGKYIIHRLGNQLYLNLLVCLFGWESILFLYQVVA